MTRRCPICGANHTTCTGSVTPPVTLSLEIAMAPKNVWTADRRLYLDKDGKVVEASDPTKATLLVPAGGALPYERAQALGLIVEPALAEEVAPPAAKPTPKNKAKKPGEAKDGDGAGAGAPDGDATPPPAEE